MDHVKKKRVLPQWMLDPESNKTQISEVRPKPKEDKPTVYVMSPYELEQTARLILAETENI